MERSFQEFAATVKFLQDHGFEIYKYPLELLFQNFRKEIEYNHRGKLEEIFELRQIRWLVFDYLGWSTYSMGLNQEVEKNLCPQIWNFMPELEDFSDDLPFNYIIERLEEIINAKIPIEEITYLDQENYSLKFDFRSQKIKLTEESIFSLGIEFIFKIAKLTRGEFQFGEIKVINTDPAIAFTCRSKDLGEIIEFLGISESQLL